MKKYTIFFVLFLLASLPFYAQNKISGKVTDSNGTPIVGALIKATKGNVSTYSKFNGTFELLGVQLGAEIEVSYYKMETIKASAQSSMNFVMIPQGETPQPNQSETSSAPNITKATQQSNNSSKSFTPENMYAAPAGVVKTPDTYTPSGNNTQIGNNSSKVDYTYQPQVNQDKNKSSSMTGSRNSSRMDILITAQIAIPGFSPFQPALGLQYGMAKKWGFYVQGVAPVSGYTISHTSQKSWTNGKMQTQYWAVSGGALWNVVKPLYLSLGAGYSSRTVYWGLQNTSSYYINSADSYKSPSFEAGFILRFGWFAASASATMGGLFDNGYSGFVGNFGIGVFF